MKRFIPEAAILMQDIKRKGETPFLIGSPVAGPAQLPFAKREYGLTAVFDFRFDSSLLSGSWGLFRFT